MTIFEQDFEEVRTALAGRRVKVRLPKSSSRATITEVPDPAYAGLRAVFQGPCTIGPYHKRHLECKGTKIASRYTDWRHAPPMSFWGALVGATRAEGLVRLHLQLLGRSSEEDPDQAGLDVVQDWLAGLDVVQDWLKEAK